MEERAETKTDRTRLNPGEKTTERNEEKCSESENWKRRERHNKSSRRRGFRTEEPPQ